MCWANDNIKHRSRHQTCGSHGLQMWGPCPPTLSQNLGFFSAVLPASYTPAAQPVPAPGPLTPVTWPFTLQDLPQHIWLVPRATWVSTLFHAPSARNTPPAPALPQSQAQTRVSCTLGCLLAPHTPRAHARPPRDGIRGQTPLCTGQRALSGSPLLSSCLWGSGDSSWTSFPTRYFSPVTRFQMLTARGVGRS